VDTSGESQDQNQRKQNDLKSSIRWNQSILATSGTNRKRDQDDGDEDDHAEDGDKVKKKEKHHKAVQEVQYCLLCHVPGHCATIGCKAKEVHTFKKVESV
jgi:hypothetical protein